MLIIENDLLKKEWNTRKNDEIGLDPAKLVVGSNKYAFWKCSVCGNEWKAQIAKRGVRGQGCPVCGKTKQIKGLIENQIKIQGSLLDNYPDIAAEWNYEKNTERPEGVLSGSNQKVFWICSKCGHTWKASIASRVKGAGCPICGRKKGKESLLRGLIKANGSLADNAPEIAAEWDYSKNEELTPNQVMLKTNKSVWWICSECGY